MRIEQLKQKLKKKLKIELWRKLEKHHKLK
jgi:hypothetical protein